MLRVNNPVPVAMVFGSSVNEPLFLTEEQILAL